MLTGTVREAKEGDSLQLVIKFVPLWNASAHARSTILSYIPVLEENPLGILSFRGYFALQSCFSYGDSPPFSVRPSFENHMGTTVPNLGAPQAGKIWDTPQAAEDNT